MPAAVVSVLDASIGPRWAIRSATVTQRVRDRPSGFGVGWWLFVALLAGVAAYVANAFVGLLVTGLLGYRATRPINERFDGVLDSDAIAAAATVLVVILPIVVLTLYAVVRLALAVGGVVDEAVDPVAFATQYFGLGDLPTDERAPLTQVVQTPTSSSRTPAKRPGPFSRAARRWHRSSRAPSCFWPFRRRSRFS